MRRRRPTPRPGVTAAATTAVLATGAAPGVTALATTAVFATGWPMTPTRPARPGLRGMSVSFGRGCLIGLDRGDDRLNGDASAGNQLATGTPRRRCEGRDPEVFPNEYSRRGPRVHRGGEMLDVVFCQELRQLSLHRLQRSKLVDVGKLPRVDRPVLVLGEDQHVDDADRSGIDQRDELVGHLTREVGGPCRELDDDVVDG